MRSPVTWYGGKGNAVKCILPHLEAVPHRTYVEPFGGGASILLAKRPAPVEVYNDVHRDLVNLFKVIADETLFKEFQRRAALLPYSRQLFYEYRDTLADELDPVTRAVKFYVVARQCFSGSAAGGNASWSFSVTASRRGMSMTTSGWLSGIEALPALHARLQRVQIECADWTFILDTYDTPDTLFYLDPPYHMDTRSSNTYTHEMDDDGHRALVARLLTLRGKAVISGYDHAVYAPLTDAGWRKLSWDTVSSAAGRTRKTGIQGDGAALVRVKRTEVLWLSPGSASQMRLFGEDA